VAWNVGWEEVEEVAQNNPIVEQQLEAHGEPLASTPWAPSDDEAEFGARPANQWETEGEDVRSLPFQLRAPIQNRSRARITTKL
jgi:hypothetical protein